MLDPAFLARPIAHRALHDRADGRPENSLAAARGAIAAGYGIEIDIQLSADGVPMVFHDYHLGRLTGTQGPIAVHSADALRRITLSGGDEGIPTLTEMLETVRGQVPLLIELKDQTGKMGASDGRLEQATAAALKGYKGPVAIMSFNPHSVAKMAEYAPHIARGLTTSAFTPADWTTLPASVRDHLREIPDFDRTGASFISHEAADLLRPRVAELKARGVPILCWTVRSPAAEAVARQVADNITFEAYLP